MTALNFIGWASLALGLLGSWYAQRCLKRSIESLDVALAAFDAALVARLEAKARSDSASEDRKATLALLQETRRVMGPGACGDVVVSCGVICGQKDCRNYAALKYTWPGRDEAAICAEHAPKLKARREASARAARSRWPSPEEHERSKLYSERTSYSESGGQT